MSRCCACAVTLLSNKVDLSAKPVKDSTETSRCWWSEISSIKFWSHNLGQLKLWVLLKMAYRVSKLRYTSSPIIKWIRETLAGVSQSNQSIASRIIDHFLLTKIISFPSVNWMNNCVFKTSCLRVPDRKPTCHPESITSWATIFTTLETDVEKLIHPSKFCCRDKNCCPQANSRRRQASPKHSSIIPRMLPLREKFIVNDLPKWFDNDQSTFVAKNLSGR